jgi:hypothetical protein
VSFFFVHHFFYLIPHIWYSTIMHQCANNTFVHCKNICIIVVSFLALYNQFFFTQHSKANITYLSIFKKNLITYLSTFMLHSSDFVLFRIAVFPLNTLKWIMKLLGILPFLISPLWSLWEITSHSIIVVFIAFEIYTG